MITTVTLDPRVELTMEAAGLRPGQDCRTHLTATTVRGSGLDVSIALRALGQPTLCTGIGFDGGGQRLLDHLERHTVSQRLVTAHGELATDIRLADPVGEKCTLLTQQDPPIHPSVVERYLDTLRDCGAYSSVVVLAGRVPDGLDETVYRRSILALKKLPVKVVVDGAGKPLKEALRQKPYLVKQSVAELEATFGVRCGSVSQLVEACTALYRNRGVEMACVTMDGGGALILSGEAAFVASSPAAGAAGKGTGAWLTAGLCKGIREGAGIDGMLRYGVAAAAAAALREDPLGCRWDDFCRMLPMVRMEQLELAGKPEPHMRRKERQSKSGRKQKTR